MNIKETKVNGFDMKPIKVNKKPVPQSTNKALPMLYNTQLYIGSKGRGKTHALVRLLKNYENDKIKDNEVEYEMRTILIAPTAGSYANVIYETLKSLDKNDIHLEYSDELLKSILDDIESKDQEFKDYIEYKKVYDKFLKLKRIEKMDILELQILEIHDFMSPKDYYGDITPKINFLIFDDLIGTGAFNKKAKSLISNLTIKHRHLKTNLIFTTQSFKLIPAVVRTNIDIYCIFKSASYNEILNKIFEDVSGYITYNKFKELYEYSTQDAHDCLTIINNSLDKSGTSFYKNWNTKLEFIEDNNDDIK